MSDEQVCIMCGDDIDKNKRKCPGCHHPYESGEDKKVCIICGEDEYEDWGYCPGCHHPYEED